MYLLELNSVGFICMMNFIIIFFLAETNFVNRDFLCRSGRTIPVSMRCILDYDVYDDEKGCRDLSHLDDCGRLDFAQ